MESLKEVILVFKMDEVVGKLKSNKSPGWNYRGVLLGILGHYSPCRYSNPLARAKISYAMELAYTNT